MIEEFVPDGLWELVEPLLPPPRPRRHRCPGRRPVGDRAALAGIVFVLKTGMHSFKSVTEKTAERLERSSILTQTSFN